MRDASATAMPWNNRVSRRTVLCGALGLSLAGLLAACGGDDDDDGGARTPTSSAAAVTSTIAATATVSASPTIQDDGNSGAETRTFVDETGADIIVPVRAQRIVAIHDINGGAQLLSLGAPVVGIAVRESGHREDITRFFDVEALATVGQVYEPDIEAIVELQPDLIVGEGFDGGGMGFDENIQGQLEAIAPVVYIDTFRPVEEVMDDFVALLGPEYADVANQQKGQFDATIDSLIAVFGDGWEDITASLVAKNGDVLEAWGPTALVPTDILTRVGVTWVPLMLEAGEPENGGYLSGGVSVERIGEFSADLVLVQTAYDTAILDDPLYQQLDAVESDQVIDLAEEFGGTHYDNYRFVAEVMLEDLTALAGDFDASLVEESP